MSLSLWRPKVQRLVRDGAGILVVPDDFDFSLDEAVKRYSRVRPRRWVVDLAGSGAFDYDLPASWDQEFSRIEQVEYPAGRREPSLVDPLDWTLYQAPAGTQLRLLADQPRVGETVRITFPGLHTVTEDATTVPQVDHHAVIHLGAGICCEQLASYYSNEGDSLIQADSVNHRSKAQEYAARAKRFFQLADQLLPVQEQGEVRAAGGETSWGEQVGLLTHPER